jgi:hypothetical protein
LFLERAEKAREICNKRRNEAAERNQYLQSTHTTKKRSSHSSGKSATHEEIRKLTLNPIFSAAFEAAYAANLSSYDLKSPAEPESEEMNTSVEITIFGSETERR